MKTKIHDYLKNNIKIMSKTMLLGMMLLFVTLSSQAQAKISKNAKYNIEVNGNCEMCKKRIEKAAYSVAGVKSAEWHSDDHMLHIILNEEKSSVSDVKKAIAKVGHDTDDFKAEQSVYDKLHGCCQYERVP